MQLADHSVPKINPNGAAYGGEGGLAFYSLQEGLRRAEREYAGRVLLVGDRGSYSALSHLVRGKDTVLVILTGDALPLFSMPSAACVVAAGERDALHAARCFAAVCGAACVLYPHSLALDGAFEERATRLLGVDAPLPLASGQVVCDLDFAGEGSKEALARLALARLALLEARALRAFRIACGNIAAEEGVYRALSPIKARTPAEIASCNAAVRAMERAGGYAGEGVLLAQMLQERGVRRPAWQAYSTLLTLYSAFFRKGKPRRYSVPDYRARALRAGVPYASVRIPTVQEYARRALTLEEVRGAFCAELAQLEKGRNDLYCAVCAADGGEGADGAARAALALLPERGGGLSALMRDFGLLEEL